MRDILSKLDKILNESALNSKDPKGDYSAKRKALDDLERDGKTDKSVIQQRRLDLDKEAERMGVKEETTLQDLKKEPLAKDPVIAKAIADKEKEEGSQQEDLFQIGDDFGISFNEDFEVSTYISDIVEDGIVINLDEKAIEFLESNGIRFLDDDLIEAKMKGKDPCWKGYKMVGTKKKGGREVPNCVPEGIEEARKAATNFTPDDIAKLQTINDLETMKAQALELISKPSERPMKPEKIQWFKSALERMQNKNAVIKLMYDLLLSGEGQAVIGSRSSMSPNSYRQRFNDDIDTDIGEAEYQGRNVPLGKPMKGDVKKSKVYVKNPQGRVVKVNFGDKKMRIKKSNPNRRKSFRARHNCDNPGPRHKARYWSCRAW